MTMFDSLKAFINDQCNFGPRLYAYREDLKKAIEQHLNESISNDAFKEFMERIVQERNLIPHKSNKGLLFYRLTLKATPRRLQRLHPWCLEKPNDVMLQKVGDIVYDHERSKYQLPQVVRDWTYFVALDTSPKTGAEPKYNFPIQQNVTKYTSSH